MSGFKSRQWGLFTIALLSSSFCFAQSPKLPALPLQTPASDLSDTPSPGKVWTPKNSTDLQGAINAANFGDVIELQAATEYDGGFTLPDKGSNSNNLWITIRSSSWWQLPSEQTRVGPGDAANMPKLASQDGNPVFATVGSARNYRLLGLEITANPNIYSANLVQFGADHNQQITTGQVPTHLVIDRCYIHGATSTQKVRRGVYLNSAYSAVIDSYISEIHSSGEDNQAIFTSNTPGILLIRNNYLEAAGENFLSGGDPAANSAMVPSDVTFIRNYSFKQPKWNPADPAYDGSNWTVKNLFEIKDGQRFLIQGNTFSNNWAAAQDGTAILMQLVFVDDSGPYSVLQDLTFEDNLVQNSPSGYALSEWEVRLPQVCQRVLLKNNIFDNIYGGSTGQEKLFFFSASDTDVTVQNNSALNRSSRMLWMQLEPLINFTFQNNVAVLNYYGVIADSSDSGWDSLVLDAGPQNTISSRFAGNVLINSNAKSFLSDSPAGVNSYPSSNSLPNSIASVGFDDSTADPILKYRLTSASPYLTAGTNGTTPGANIDELSQARQGIISGVTRSPSTDFIPSLNSSNTSYILSVKAITNSTRVIEMVMDGETWYMPHFASLPIGTHTIVAPAAWTDYDGTVYQFTQWSDGSTATTRTINLESYVELVATYVVQSAPAANYILSIKANTNSSRVTEMIVDGATWYMPHFASLTAGSHTIVAPSTWTDYNGKTYLFTQWSDGSTATARTINLQSYVELIATYVAR